MYIMETGSMLEGCMFTSSTEHRQWFSAALAKEKEENYAGSENHSPQ